MDQPMLGDPQKELPKMAFASSWSGVPENEGTAFKWKSAVIVSTITARYPGWKVKPKVDPPKIERWNGFIGEVEHRGAEKEQIYQRSVESLGAALSALRRPTENDLKNESEALFQKMQVQVEMRQKGLSRRKDPLPKKKPPAKK
jgi:hypothetical protein